MKSNILEKIETATNKFLDLSPSEKDKLTRLITTFVDHTKIAIKLAKNSKKKQDIIQKMLEKIRLPYSPDVYNTILRISSVHTLCEEIIQEAIIGHFLDFDVQESFFYTIKQPDNNVTDTEILEDAAQVAIRIWNSGDKDKLFAFLKILELKLAVETFHTNMLQKDATLKSNKIPYSEIEVDPNADAAHLMVHGGDITLEQLFLEILPVFKKYKN